MNGWEAEPSEGTYGPKEEKPSHLLDPLRRRLLGNAKVPKRVACKGWTSYRNVNKLKAAGINIKPNKSGSLRDISFKSYRFYGVLKLPQITIDDSTTSRFLNSIAYEMCLEVPSEVTSHTCFLHLLIDDLRDVKELKQQGVFRNLLGSNEVVTPFNVITIDSVPNSDAHNDVKEGILHSDHFDDSTAHLGIPGCSLSLLL